MGGFVLADSLSRKENATTLSLLGGIESSFAEPSNIQDSATHLEGERNQQRQSTVLFEANI